MSSQRKSLNAMTLLVLATAMLFLSSSGGFLIKGVEGRKLLQEETTSPSEDILEEQDLTGGEYAMAMAPAPAPAPTMMTMEVESIVVEREGEVPAKKRRRSLLQELGNGPVPSGAEEILGEIYDVYDEMFAPAPAPATTTEEEEILPPVRRKMLQMMEGMMPDMTGMPDPLPSTGEGAMDVGEAPAPAPTATTDEEILDEEVIPPVRKLLQKEGDVMMDEVIAVPPTEAPIAEAPAPAPAPIEDIGMIVEETPGRKLLQEELEPQPVINGEEEQEVPTTEEEEATAEAPSPIIGTFEITTITGTITAAEDYDPDMTGPN